MSLQSICQSHKSYTHKSPPSYIPKGGTQRVNPLFYPDTKGIYRVGEIKTMTIDGKSYISIKKLKS